VFSLVYSSTATKPFTKDAIEQLLMQARSRNFIYGITGLLIYDYGAFLQVLEGRKMDVEEIFASIKCDPRHTGIVVVKQEPIEVREFTSWTMAYADISLGVVRPPGYFPGILTRTNPETAQSYLRFYRPARRD
jgi:hypothetical protein